MDVNLQEALRYLGYGKAQPDKRVLQELEWAISEIMNGAKLGYVYHMLDCSISEDSVQIGGLKIQSKNLAKNLEGCHQAVLFAATLGTHPDMLQKRYAHLDMSRAVLLQAAAAAIIEGYCDQCQDEISQKLGKGLHLRPRFSPGYGDFGLEVQPKILFLLDAHRKLGLTTTDSFMLAPTKSVTAVIGIGIKEKKHYLRECQSCNKIDCDYRRTEKE